MKTIVEALKSFYEKIGGASWGAPQTISEALDKITAATPQGGGGDLPAVAAADNGKILLVSGGVWAKGNAPTELPAVTGTDNGKILLVSGGKWVKGSAPVELPTYDTTEDAGKVLQVTADGVAWVTPS